MFLEEEVGLQVGRGLEGAWVEGWLVGCWRLERRKGGAGVVEEVGLGQVDF